MALSKEYTHWHLTPNDWIAGETRTDFSNFFAVPIPDDRVLTILYEEVMTSAFSKVITTEEIIFEIEDKNYINELKQKFPINLYICPPD